MTNKSVSYFIPQTFVITLLEGDRINLPMFRRDIKIFRGVDNNIDFELRDADRKPIKLLDRNIQIVITNPENQELMLVRNVEITDERKGKYRLKLTPGDIQSWSQGFYQFGAILIEDDGAEYPLYTDTAQNNTGKLILVDAPFPSFIPSTLLTEQNFQSVNGAMVSQRLRGDAQKNYQDGLQTFSVQTDNFTGKLWVQGSLEDNPTQDGEYFDIYVGSTAPYIEFTNSTITEPFNFDGNFVWIRFKYIPDSANVGNIEKIWYKN